MRETLLIELLTEELPPKALGRLGETFAEGVADGLRNRRLADENAQARWYATPRRLALSLSAVLAQAPDEPFTERLMPVAVAFDGQGQPTPALLKKLEAKGISVERVSTFERRVEGKSEMLYYSDVAPGARLEDCLETVVQDALGRLPIPKVMRWGDTDHQFVRPVHGLVMMHGGRVLAGEVLGLKSGNSTLGHRFLSVGPVTIPHAEEYEAVLEREGRVIASFAERRRRIEAGLDQAAAGGIWIRDEALLDEVTALVECPAVYSGTFNPEFLVVPQECLILSMKQHQKYFPLLDKGGKLLPRFLVVSNLLTDQPAPVIHGNERVLRARLSDAKFFFEQDKKQPLGARVPRLAEVVYHNKLGTQLARVERIRKLAGEIAGRLGADVGQAERAAYLCKADLLTDMVGEFPELQGMMGQYYARHDGEPDAVAGAIEAHYRPRFAGDALPADNVGASVALADKLDTLVGIYGVGLVPTGDKDPFGLRRQALGILRILVESPLPLDILQLLQSAKSQFPAEVVADSVAVDVHGFMLERLRNYLKERGFEPGEIDAVVSQGPTRVDQVIGRLEAVRAFKTLPEAEALAAANKRIQNILRKAEIRIQGAIDHALLQEDAEKALYEAISRIEGPVLSLVRDGAYTEALRMLAGVRAEVDRFFDEVMVMTEEPLVRNNRLALLGTLGNLMNQVADISKLAV